MRPTEPATRRRRATLGVRLALVAALLPVLGRAGSPRLALAPCRLNGGLQARCGALEVPEDSGRADGRHLALHLAVVPALARSPRVDPLFVLAGGPGQAATELGTALVGQALERVHRTRDIVLVDQRGTGGSNPLACETVDPRAPLPARLEVEGLDLESLKGCLAKYQADPRFFTTSRAMDDLEAVRLALGYGKINLWGGSYGTRAALVYLRRHPDSVRAVVLDGVAPPTEPIPLHLTQNAQRAMDLLLSACAAAPDCAAAWPDLPTRFTHLLDRLEKAPPRVTLADPLTGAPVTLTVHRSLVTGVLRSLLYQPGMAALVPLLITRADSGDFAPLVALATTTQGELGDGVAFGMHLSVLCAEDLPRIPPEAGDAEPDPARSPFVRTHDLRTYREACSVWPRGEVPPDFGAAVESEAPVLLLSGELDPVTPPALAEEAKRTLPHGRHFVVPGVGHGASSVGCVPRLMNEFLEAGRADRLDGSCISGKRPPFFVSFAGPTP